MPQIPGSSISGRSLEIRQQRFGQFALAFASLCGICWYLFVSINCTVAEIALTLIGLTGLWLPVGWLVALFTAQQFEDRLTCLTFSAIASYGLTTTIYFLCSVIGLWISGFEHIFYVFQVVAIVICIGQTWRRGGTPRSGDSRIPALLRHTNWILVSLIVASSISTARYKNVLELNRSQQTYLLATDGDQTLYLSVANECSRQVPMRQTPYRAGRASRAYHMFPHLTTALIGRFTFQPDLVRAHLVYEYTFIETLTLLALFSLGRQLTGSLGAGYVAVALMFLAAVPVSPLYTDLARNFMYFCLWPQSSSTVEPVLYTSPQQYSGILVTYGVFLATSAVSRHIARGSAAGRIMIVNSLLAAIIVRFRVQTFLPLLPGLLLLNAYWFRRTRSWIYLVASGLAIAVSATLLLEMNLPIYLPNTSTLSFGNNLIGLHVSFLNSWPGARWAHDRLALLLSAESVTFQWIWQILCLTMFSMLNIVGIPLMIASMAFFIRRHSWVEFGGLTYLIAWLVTCSLAGAMCIAATYDFWSVGGQMLLHTNWYLFPLLSAGIWTFRGWIPARMRSNRSVVYGLSYATLILLFVWQCVRPSSLLEKEIRTRKITIDVDDSEALRHIRTHLDQDAVIVSNNFHGPSTAVISGIGGRRTYLEYIPSQERFIDAPNDTEQTRYERIRELWSIKNEDQFRQLLPDVVTHVVEFRDVPLQFEPLECLKKVWVSTSGRVRIWEVVR